MATMEDALMEDTSIMPDANMTLDSMEDDLFGEATDGLSMGVALPLPSLPAALVLRIAEMQRCGCCTKLAWSNTGSIAQIVEDGKKINFRTMQRNQKTSVWAPSEASKHVIVPPGDRKFVHVQWNGLGIDLAVVDDLGTVQVYSMVGAVGKMHHAQGDFLSNEEQLGGIDAIVGMHWLPLYPNEFRSLYITPATKIDNKWVTRTKTGDLHGSRVHHPAENRNALMHVNRTGKLSLLYQNETAIWQSTVIELHASSVDVYLLTHAAFVDNGDHLLLCTHDSTHSIWLYKISIHWNAAQQKMGMGPMTITTVNPKFEIGRLVTLENVAAQHADSAQLSHLRIVPAPPEVAEQGSLLPTVLAIFTHAPLSVDATQQPQDAFSIIGRWTVDSAAPVLHESFAKLIPNGPSSVQTLETLLTRQHDIILTKPALTVDIEYFNTVIALAASDGIVDFRDRATFDTIETYEDLTSVSSLPRSGLEHMMGEHHLHNALSADGSALAFVRVDGTLGTKVMSPRYGWQPLEDGISDTKGLVETAIVCLARQYAILTAANSANDETLAVLPSDLSSDMRVLFVKETFRSLSRNPDISMLDQSKQQQMAFKDPFIPRILSAQLVLGTKPGSMRRTFAGQFAYVQLNLRLISMALAQTITRGQEGKPDMLPSLVGLVRWGTELMAYMLDSILPILRDEQAKGNPKHAFEKLVAESGSPATHLLLCSFSRTFLKFHTSYIALYLRSVQAGRQRAKTVLERQQLIDVYETAKSLPTTIAAFQELLSEIDQAVRNAYTEAKTTPERRMEIELAMMTEGTVPDEFVPVLQMLLETSLPKIAESTDMGKLYFWDTEWLGIAYIVPPKGAVRYDAIRKTPLPPHAKLRVCRRCGAQMEEVPPEQTRPQILWLAHAQRQCYCLNYWWAVS